MKGTSSPLNRELISSKDAAQRAGFTHDYISRLCRFGKVDGEKIGNAWYIDERSLEDFLAKQQAKREVRKQALSEERKVAYKEPVAIKSSRHNTPHQVKPVSLHLVPKDSLARGLGRVTGIKVQHGGLFSSIAFLRTKQFAFVFAFFCTLGFVSFSFSESRYFEIVHKNTTDTFSPFAIHVPRTQDLGASLVFTGEKLFATGSKNTASVLSGAIDLLSTTFSDVAEQTQLAFETIRGVFSFSSNEGGITPVTRLEDLAQTTDNSVEGADNNFDATEEKSLVIPSVTTLPNESSGEAGNVVLGINTDVTVRDGIRIGGSTTLGSLLQVSGLSTFNNLIQARGGINTSGADINAGAGRLFASNVINSIQAGANITITGTPQNIVISSSGGVVRSGGGGATVFTGLTDTPSSLTENTIFHVDTAGSAITTTSGFTFNGTTLSTPLLSVTSTGTSTISNGLNVGLLNVTSAATSTFANGIQLTEGCLLLPDGLCAISQAGSGASNYLGLTDTPSSHTAQGVIYTNTGGTALTATTTFTFDGTNLGIGTSTPYSKLSVWADGSATGARVFELTDSASTTLFYIDDNGALYSTGLGTFTSGFISNASSTIANGGLTIAGVATTTNGLVISGGAIDLTSGATSTFSNGLSLSNGCFSINGFCSVTRGEINTYAELNAIVADQTLIHQGLIDTSSEFASIISDETGSGLLVFNTNPTLQGFISVSSSTVDANLTVTGTFTTDAFITSLSSATSTFSGGVDSAGLSSSNGLTVTGGALLYSGGATTTLNNGANISAGCFAINDVCVGSGLGDGTFLGLSDTPSSYTTGSVLFTSGSAVTEDNTNFFFDDTNNRLGIGTSTPYSKLTVWGTGTGSTILANFANSASTSL
ncbi:MAG TPA: helix-turn-helix domain-containing protein, partial [Candidatus Paceibacterota bacterium]